MKKLLVVLLAVVMVFGTVALVACQGDKTAEAYGRVHAGYAGYTKVTVDKDGKIIDVVLDEACGPTQVTAPETVAEDYVVLGGRTGTSRYYKTAKMLDLTWEYVYKHGEGDNETIVNDYVTKKADGTIDKKFKDYINSAEISEKYFKEASAGTVKVVTGADTELALTKAQLLKTENGYWTGENYPLGWKGNVDATIAYVKANGVNDAYTKADFVADTDSKIFVDKDGVSTGATWTDFFDYYTIIRNAYNAAK